MSWATFVVLWNVMYNAFIWTYVAGSFAWSFPRLPEWARTFKREAHPFAPFIVLADLAVNTWGSNSGLHWWLFAGAVAFVAAWLFDRDDDDRWKRRRKRLSARVRSAGHRLVVEPS